MRARGKQSWTASRKEPLISILTASTRVFRIKTFQQGTDLGLRAPNHHIEHAARLQIAENRGIALALAPSKVINQEETRGRQGGLRLQGAPLLAQPCLGHRLQAGLHQARPHVEFRRHMGYRTGTGLGANRLAETLGGPPSPATDAIGFGEAASTGEAPEAALDQQQADLSPSQRHIAFAAQPLVMLLGIDPPTVRAGCPVCAAENRHLYSPFTSVMLAENLKAWQS
jgi:hypothetical protein